jgi:uncharacterized protein (DUF2147 family)
LLDLSLAQAQGNANIWDARVRPNVTLERACVWPQCWATALGGAQMKQFIIATALVLMASMAQAADPAEGTWKTKADDNGNFGFVQIKTCGPAVCGTLVKSFDSKGKEMKSPNVGKQIIWDMKSKGNGAYSDGKVWSPDRDKTYNSKMQLSGDSLAIQGCVFVVCRDGGTWTRVK